MFGTGRFFTEQGEGGGTGEEVLRTSIEERQETNEFKFSSAHSILYSM